jgi:hypothetical protein
MGDAFAQIEIDDDNMFGTDFTQRTAVSSGNTQTFNGASEAIRNGTNFLSSS